MNVVRGYMLLEELESDSDQNLIICVYLPMAPWYMLRYS